jgi:hypothetical protein
VWSRPQSSPRCRAWAARRTPRASASSRWRREPWAFTSRDRDDLAAQGTFGAAAIALCDGRDFCLHGAHTALGLRRAAALLLPYRPAIAAT